MRAFQLTEPRRAELRDVAEPEPGPGEVLLRVTGAGVCHSDLHILHAPVPMFPFPMTFGHEVAGTVAARGPGVTGWDDGEGALVACCWGCGRCRSCVAGAENYCEAHPRATVPGGGLGFDGGMAELVVVPARQLVRLGDLDPVAAAPLTDAGLTPYHAISLAADRLVGRATVVVIGVGGLGHMAVQILRATTGATVVAVDTDEAALDQAAALGADRTLISGDDTAAQVLAITGGVGADVVLDFVGLATTLATGAGCVRSGGQLTMVGLAAGKLQVRADAPPMGLPWGVTVVKPYAGTRRDLHDVVALARAGSLTVHVERYPLADAAEVFDRLDQGRISGRAVLVP